MDILCPVRVKNGLRKHRLRRQSGPPPGRLTGSDSIDTLVRVELEKQQLADSGGGQSMVIVHDFDASSVDEISVKRGQRVVILYRDHDWVYVIRQQDAVEGFVPYSYCVPLGGSVDGITTPSSKRSNTFISDTNQNTTIYETNHALNNAAKISAKDGDAGLFKLDTTSRVVGRRAEKAQSGSIMTSPITTNLSRSFSRSNDSLRRALNHYIEQDERKESDAKPQTETEVCPKQTGNEQDTIKKTEIEDIFKQLSISPPKSLPMDLLNDSDGNQNVYSVIDRNSSAKVCDCQTAPSVVLSSAKRSLDEERRRNSNMYANWHLSPANQLNSTHLIEYQNNSTKHPQSNRTKPRRSILKKPSASFHTKPDEFKSFKDYLAEESDSFSLTDSASTVDLSYDLNTRDKSYDLTDQNKSYDLKNRENLSGVNEPPFQTAWSNKPTDSNEEIDTDLFPMGNGIVLFRYQGNSLSVKPGDTVRVIQRGQEPGWSFIQDCKGLEGYIPANYIMTLEDFI